MLPALPVRSLLICCTLPTCPHHLTHVPHFKCLVSLPLAQSAQDVLFPFSYRVIFKDHPDSKGLQGAIHQPLRKRRHQVP